MLDCLFLLGQFICGEKRCDEKEHLRSWEVLFGYVEHGKKRDALVKLSKAKDFDFIYI